MFQLKIWKKMDKQRNGCGMAEVYSSTNTFIYNRELSSSWISNTKFLNKLFENSYKELDTWTVRMLHLEVTAYERLQYVKPLFSKLHVRDAAFRNTGDRRLSPDKSD